MTGGAKLSRLDLSLGKRRLLRTGQRTLRVRVPVATLRSGSHTLLAVAVDKARDRSTASATFRRC